MEAAKKLATDATKVVDTLSKKFEEVQQVKGGGAGAVKQELTFAISRTQEQAAKLVALIRYGVQGVIKDPTHRRFLTTGADSLQNSCRSMLRAATNTLANVRSCPSIIFQANFDYYYGNDYFGNYLRI